MKQNKKIIATFYDTKQNKYEFIEETKSKLFNRQEKWVETYLYSVKHKEIIESWNMNLIEFDIKELTLFELDILLNQVLKTSVQVNTLLQKVHLNKEVIPSIWGNYLGEKSFVQSTILVNQDIADLNEFIMSLNLEEQWLFLTQNKYRTVQNMSKYDVLLVQVFSEFLSIYLAPQKVVEFEQIYGIWRTLMKETLETYFPHVEINGIIEKGLEHVYIEILQKQNELSKNESIIADLDNQYLEMKLSEKYKLEDKVKKLVTQQGELYKELESIEIKKNAIKAYFFN